MRNGGVLRKAMEWELAGSPGHKTSTHSVTDACSGDGCLPRCSLCAAAFFALRTPVMSLKSPKPESFGERHWVGNWKPKRGTRSKRIAQATRRASSLARE